MEDRSKMSLEEKMVIDGPKLANTIKELQRLQRQREQGSGKKEK